MAKPDRNQSDFVKMGLGEMPLPLDSKTAQEIPPCLNSVEPCNLEP